MVKILAIIGSQRSGTTVLARTLAAAGNASYFGEVFHCDPSERSKVSNYFSWYDSSIAHKDITNRLFVSYDSAERHCREFLSHLVSIGSENKSDFIVIDLKYPVFNFVEWPWAEAHQRPTLIHSLIQHFDSHIVHMRRQNLVDAYFSRIRAEEAQTWHDDTEKSLRCHVDKWLLEDFIVMSLQVSFRFSHLLSRCEPHHVAELIYEECFNSSRSGISDCAKESLLPILISLQIDASDLSTTITKSQRASWEIDNIKEIYEYFGGSVYEELFRSSISLGNYWQKPC